MSVTQRAEFASVIQRGGGNIESLLQTLRQRVGAAS
jgi:phospholipid transport system substrate-binding protein